MIIYVEDNINNQRLLAKMLSKRSLEVLAYDDPNDAFVAILEKKPELIFVDVHLKTRQSGLDLVRRLRTEGIETPIIAVTIFAMLADKKRAEEIGCTDYLAKPYQMKDLFTMIDRYLSKES